MTDKESDIMMLQRGGADINNLLASLSASDSVHDFHKITGIFNMIKEKKNIYESGLPDNSYIGTNFSEESIALSSVIAKVNGADDNNFAETMIGNNPTIQYANDGTLITASYPILTKNGNEYQVTSAILASGSTKSDTKEYIDAHQFIDTFDIEDKSAFIIDATALSILNILKKGQNVNKTIFYLVTPEIINDPADKTLVDDKIFNNIKNNADGVVFYSCEPNIPESFNYDYSFKGINDSGNYLKDNNKSAINKFFTKYNFKLSEVQRNRKGKNIKYTTNLNITNPDINGKIVPVICNDSGEQNKISALQSAIANLFNLLSKKPSTTPMNQFLFNAKFQQKRSGDWLQVLACLLVSSRPTKIYRTPGTPQQRGDVDIEKQISKVYFLTHDRIALAFALLCGVECIYTHASSKSAYVFKSSSLADRTNFEAKMNEQKNNILYGIINATNDNTLTKKITILNERLGIYNTFRYGFINAYTSSIQTILNENYTLSLTDNTEFNAFTFNNFTSELFQNVVTLNYLLSIFPDLQEQMIYINTNYQLLNSQLPYAINLTDYKEKEAVIGVYNGILASIDSLNKTLDTYVTSSKQINVNLESSLVQLRKTPNFKLVSGWNWDKAEGNSRIWSAFINVVQDKSYKSDKNSFLYSIDVLQLDIKKLIHKKYKIIYDKLSNPETTFVETNSKNITITTPLIDKRLDKFKIVAKGFCVEVFINFAYCLEAGENGIISEPKDNIELDKIVKVNLEDNNNNNILKDSVIIAENSVATIDSRVFERTDIKTLGSFVDKYYSDTLTSANVEEKYKQQLKDNETTYDENNYNIINGGAITRSMTAAMRATATSASANSSPTSQVTTIIYPYIETNIKKTTYVLLNAQKDFCKTTSWNIWKKIEGGLIDIDIIGLKRGRPSDNKSSDESMSEESNKRGRIEYGGGFSVEEKIESLNEFVSKLTLPDSDEILPLPKEPNADLLKDYCIGSHPMLPIYMMAEALNTIADENIQESIDYEYYLKFLSYLEKLRNKLVQVYVSKEPIDIFTAYAIGAGLNELLFTSNIYNTQVKAITGGRSTIPLQDTFVVPSLETDHSFEESNFLAKDTLKKSNDLAMGPSKPEAELPSIPKENSYFTEVLNMDESSYRIVALTTRLLSGAISGMTSQNEEEKQNGINILQSEIFTNYLKDVDVGSIFNVDTDISMPLESFKQNTFKFLIETGNIIISDRGDTPVEISLEEPIEASSEIPIDESSRKENAKGVEQSSFDLNKNPGLTSGNGQGITAEAGGSKKKRVKKVKRTIKRNNKAKTKRRKSILNKKKVKKNTRKHKK